MIEQANNRIIIMPGAGVTPENAIELIQKTGLKEMHGTFRSRYSSLMKYQNAKLSHQAAEYTVMAADAEKIKKIIQLF
jgi:copper homeostasis protein